MEMQQIERADPNIHWREVFNNVKFNQINFSAPIYAYVFFAYVDCFISARH